MDSMSISMMIALTVGVIFSVVGLITLIVAKQINFRCSQKIKAKIVDINVEESEDGNIYYSEYEFEVEDNKIRKRRKNGSFEINEDIGDEITVFYNQEDPSDCYADGEKNNIGISIVLILIGVFSLVVYFLVL